MSKPAHKQDDPSKYPGQFRNAIGQERQELERTGQIKNDVTLGDYIERKSKSMEKRIGIQSAAPKKLTFDEWYNMMYKDTIYETMGTISRRQAENVWFHAQENK